MRSNCNLPGIERIGLGALDHVAHCQSERVEVILDAQKLERVLPVAVDGVGLQPAHDLDLAQRVPGEDADGQQRDGEPDQQRASWRGWRHIHSMVKEFMAPRTGLDSNALNVLFRQARTHRAWLPIAVSDELLREIYDLFKSGPTSANSSPARILFIKSPEAKARLVPVARSRQRREDEDSAGDGPSSPTTPDSSI